MKEKIPWTTVIILALLVILGIGLPFWLEFRSLSSMEPDRPRVRTPVLDDRRTFFCPICGKETTFPHLHERPVKRNGPVLPLVLRSLVDPVPVVPRSAVRTPDSEIKTDE